MQCLYALCSICQAIFSFLSLNADVQAFKSIPRTCVVSLPNPLALEGFWVRRGTCLGHVCQLQRVLNRFKYIPFLLHVCVCHPLRKLSIKKSAIAHFSPSESAARLGQNALRISEARLDSYKTLPQYIFPSGLRSPQLDWQQLWNPRN